MDCWILETFKSPLRYFNQISFLYFDHRTNVEISILEKKRRGDNVDNK